jgi:hypothetical protein
MELHVMQSSQEHVSQAQTHKVEVSVKPNVLAAISVDIQINQLKNRN